MNSVKIKSNLEDIFDILYTKNRIDLAMFIQELYFHLEDDIDDSDYEADSEEESEEFIPLEKEELQFKYDDFGFYELV
jgi:hypothetical protein